MTKYKIKGGQLNRPRKCRICGCTWFHPCSGGCYWVEPDLCSRCFRKSLPKSNNLFSGQTFSIKELLARYGGAAIKILDPESEFQLLTRDSGVSICRAEGGGIDE